MMAVDIPQITFDYTLAGLDCATKSYKSNRPTENEAGAALAAPA